MKRSFSLVIALTLGMCQGIVLAQTQTDPATVPTQVSSTPASSLMTPVAQEEPVRLKGKFGIGTDSIRVDQNSTSNTSTINTSTYNALDLTWWLSDKSGLDFFATYNLTSNPGVDFDGANYAFPTYVVGAGLGYRRNLASPSRFLRLQGLLRATAARYKCDQQMQYNSTFNRNFALGRMTTNSYNFMGGLGFEFFAPFCKSLSLQSNVMFQASYNDCKSDIAYSDQMPDYGLAKPENSGYYKNYWKAGVLVNGFSLYSLSIHFYF